jgi:hypothetical protein
MARFTAVPDIPTRLAAEWESQVLDALKQNVELLAGIRGESDRISQAITKGMVRIQRTPTPFFSRVDPLTAKGEGFTISGVQVAGLTDYVRLIEDVVRLNNNMQRLAADVNNLRNSVDTLISQLRG